MNVENIRKVRDVIAGLPARRFDMRSVSIKIGRGQQFAPISDLPHRCNTAGCIAGWTLATLTPPGENPILGNAAGLLGLDLSDSDALFLPPGFLTRSHYPQPLAVAVLDHLIETGKVDWEAARKAVAK